MFNKNFEENAGGHELVRPCLIRGILHSHSNFTDGVHSLAEMTEIAKELGFEYLGISDHFVSDAHSCGLDMDSVMIQRQEIDRLQLDLPELKIFQGIEIDAHLDGTLPLDDKTLSTFDYVIASVPGAEGLTTSQFTTLIESIAQHPKVTILGRPVGDWILQQQNDLLDNDRVFTAAALGRTAVEVNANPASLPLDWSLCRKAQELGIKMVISPNAHRAARLVDFRHSAEQAHDAGLCCGSFLNTLSSTELQTYFSDVSC